MVVDHAAPVLSGASPDTSFVSATSACDASPRIFDASSPTRLPLARAGGSRRWGPGAAFSEAEDATAGGGNGSSAGLDTSSLTADRFAQSTGGGTARLRPSTTASRAAEIEGAPYSPASAHRMAAAAAAAAAAGGSLENAAGASPALARRAGAATLVAAAELRSTLSPTGRALVAGAAAASFESTSPAVLASARLLAASLSGGARSALAPPPSAAASDALAQRVVPRLPFKVLDAPALADDFYLNLLDWSASNVLAVGLSGDLYLWNGLSATVDKLHSYGSGAAGEPPAPAITAIRWAPRGGHLAVGLSSGTVEIWDVVARRVVRAYTEHRVRACSLAWSDQTLASGAKDAAIHLVDARDRSGAHTRLRGHRHEVCGLAWAPDGSALASGGNDNKVCIWSTAMSRPPPRSAAARGGEDAQSPHAPMLRIADFTAAVKGLAWSPHAAHTLAAGGGTHDRKIRVYDTSTGTLRRAVDTGAQVTQLAWSPHAPELASALGYSQNAVVVWRYPALTRLATLNGHTARVLYMAIAPDGQSIVTAGGDETLRFWSAFAPPLAAGTPTDDNLLPDALLRASAGGWPRARARARIASSGSGDGGDGAASADEDEPPTLPAHHPQSHAATVVGDGAAQADPPMTARAMPAPRATPPTVLPAGVGAWASSGMMR